MAQNCSSFAGCEYCKAFHSANRKDGAPGASWWCAIVRHAQASPPLKITQADSGIFITSQAPPASARVANRFGRQGGGAKLSSPSRLEHPAGPYPAPALSTHRAIRFHRVSPGRVSLSAVSTPSVDRRPVSPEHAPNTRTARRRDPAEQPPPYNNIIPPRRPAAARARPG